MSLLFDAPLLTGLRYQEGMIDESEEREVIEQVEQLELAPFRFHGWLGNRRTRSFGWRYDFDDASFAPTDPIPQWLRSVQARAAAFAGLPLNELVHVLIARYDPGAGIGWHRDRDVFDQVIGLSLNAHATLRFRRRIGHGFERANLPVQRRSAYVLSGEARHDWEHSISPGQTLRFSITFRTLSDKGRRIASAGP
jgi:alkylated DNA repair dioxygenase AlkB